MIWTSEETQIVIAAAICTLQVLIRSFVRIGGTLKWFSTTQQQRWHADDTWMAVSLLPLFLRTICMCKNFSFEQPLSKEDEESFQKLVMAARVTYAMFLWCMKLCLLQFYTRLETGSIRVHRAIQLLRAFIFLTFIIIILATLLECRPIYVAWRPEYTHHSCRKGTVNLLCMASLNIITDLALILFPIPLLWRMSALKFQTKVQLTLLFLVGTLVVAITITRIPLILSHSVSQQSRTLWASVEIVCSAVTANAAFYYALWKESHQFFHRFARPADQLTSQLQTPEISSRGLGTPRIWVSRISESTTGCRDSFDIAEYHLQLTTPNSSFFSHLDRLEAGEQLVGKG
ncbi:hypothetical protein MGYG_01601 [Nannizzia gypsea CBS 118893]|uniref:Rhodopsin domain-containing protein n=1 Tax=Arthroderma gypseum (strain ATCC MYA-4604 / CBS 118893) TaxID=535722 RepID=E5R1U1_ARTGP|nr:hypothetical protein MGYG_01601 [Nannizzia gypsea CBS 118893]EFQ98575.1 hypothetical protein MGYG_01601 [Nannizzia gypsea CBS 118893]